MPDMVELPYDKSLIASYLDMKPETFSRTLKKFKQKGFEIRKDAVILPQGMPVSLLFGHAPNGNALNPNCVGSYPTSLANHSVC